MARLLAGLILLLAAHPVFGQPRDWEEAEHRHRGDGRESWSFATITSKPARRSAGRSSYSGAPPRSTGMPTTT
jgi:hypothetical protein